MHVVPRGAVHRLLRRRRARRVVWPRPQCWNCPRTRSAPPRSWCRRRTGRIIQVPAASARCGSSRQQIMDTPSPCPCASARRTARLDPHQRLRIELVNAPAAVPFNGQFSACPRRACRPHRLRTHESACSPAQVFVKYVAQLICAPSASSPGTTWSGCARVWVPRQSWGAVRMGLAVLVHVAVAVARRCSLVARAHGGARVAHCQHRLAWNHVLPSFGQPPDGGLQ